MADFTAGARICRLARPSVQGIILYSEEEDNAFKVQWDNGQQSLCWGVELAPVASVRTEVDKDSPFAIARAKENAARAGCDWLCLSKSEQKSYLEQAVEQLMGTEASPTLEHLNIEEK